MSLCDHCVFKPDDGECIALKDGYCHLYFKSKSDAEQARWAEPEPNEEE